MTIDYQEGHRSLGKINLRQRISVSFQTINIIIIDDYHSVGAQDATKVEPMTWRLRRIREAFSKRCHVYLMDPAGKTLHKGRRVVEGKNI